MIFLLIYMMMILVEDKEMLDRYISVISQLAYVTSVERGNK